MEPAVRRKTEPDGHPHPFRSSTLAGPIVALGQSACHEADHTRMPGRMVDDQHALLQERRVALELCLCRLHHLLGQQLALGIQALKFGCQDPGASQVPGRE